MSLVTGTKFGPYEILGPLGAGGMGEVYRAKDTRLGRDVAVKVLPAEYAQDPERMGRFEREARAAAALNHPNILVLYDMGAHEGSPYLVTELLEGEPLRKRIAAGPLPVSKVVDYGAQVAEGLAAAHEKGIVHRDLKPENLFVTRDGRLKILDFGLARLTARESRGGGVQTEMPTMDSPTGKGVVMGTVGYMAPEQIRGEEADARSDLFAFGCVLYEMVTGKKAFTGTTYTDIAASILKEEPPDLQTTGKPVPPGLERIIRRCLEKHPEQRFQSARDLAFGLQAFSGLTGTGALPVAAGAKAARWRLALARPWGMAGLLAAGLLLGATAGIVAYRAKTRPSQPVFRQLTFRRGEMWWARFSPDGRDIYYSAAWDGNAVETFVVNPGSPESRALGLPAGSRMLAAFPSSDLLIWDPEQNLAVAPVSGGTPRKVLEGAPWADAGPDPQHICVVRYEAGVARLEYPIGKMLYKTTEGISAPRISHKADCIVFSSGGGVWVVDMAGKARCLVKKWEGELWSNLVWTPHDDEVWFTGRTKNGGWGLYGVTLGGRLRRIYAGPGRLFLNDLSADGRVLLMRGSCRYGFVVGDTKTGVERELTWLDGSNLGPLSRDGSKVLFHEDMEATAGKPVLYMRGTDGSPPVKLGEGYPCDLSPDGQWVLAMVPGEKSAQLQAIPTGAGQPRILTNDGLNHGWAKWMPDGKRFVFRGREPGKKWRFWIQSVEGGPPTPLTPEGDFDGWWTLSGDGRELACVDLGKEEEEALELVPTDGGQPRAVPPGEPKLARPLQFSSDGKALYAGWRRIFRVDLKTGQRTLVKEIKPADPAGLRLESGSTITPDGKTYAYGYYRELADLFIVEGLK